MTSINDSKRLNEEELEAVAGGVTPQTMDPLLLMSMQHGFPGLNIPAPTDTHAAAPPTIDPSAVAGLMHSTVSAAVAGGGAYTMQTPAPTATHTDAGTPTITDNTHVTVSGESLFGGSTPIGMAPVQLPADVPHATVTIVGNLNIVVPPQPAEQTVTVMHFDSTQGQFTKVTPIVQGVDESGQGPGLGGALGRSWGNF